MKTLSILTISIITLLCIGCRPSGKSILEQGQQAMHEQAIEREAAAVRNLEQADSMMAVLGVRSDSLRRLLTRVPNEIEPYLVAKGTSLPESGIQGRISPDGEVMYVVARQPQNFSQLILFTADGQEAATPAIGHDGERNATYNGVTTVHFVGAECDTLGAFLSRHRGEKVSVRTDRGRGRPLTDNERKSLLTTYEYTALQRQIRVAVLEHQRLEHTLQIARQQVARTMPDAKADSVATAR